MKKGETNTSSLIDKKVTLWDPGSKVTKFNIWPLFMYEAKIKPDKKKFSILNFWIISLFSYERDEGERGFSILRFLRFQSENRGELIDKTDTSKQ